MFVIRTFVSLFNIMHTKKYQYEFDDFLNMKLIDYN